MVLCLRKTVEIMKKMFTCVFIWMMIGCNKTDVEGSYYYVEPNKNEETDVYASFACSLVGVIKLDNGYYYNGITGEYMRLKYEVVDDNVIVDNEGFQLVLKIIDKNTIEYEGCLFKKEQE